MGQFGLLAETLAAHFAIWQMEWMVWSGADRGGNCAIAARAMSRYTSRRNLSMDPRYGQSTRDDPL